MVIWSGKVVMVSFSPAPVTRGVEPSGKELDRMLPFVMCRSKVSCRASGSDRRDLKSGVGRPSNALFVGAKIVMGPGVDNSCTRSPIFNKDTKVEKSGLNTRRSRIE